MNNSSSWNCFSWNRRKLASGERVSPRKHHEMGGAAADVPDEQFANLLGGEWTLSIFVNVNGEIPSRGSCRRSLNNFPLITKFSMESLQIINAAIANSKHASRFISSQNWPFSHCVTISRRRFSSFRPRFSLAAIDVTTLTRCASLSACKTKEMTKKLLKKLRIVSISTRFNW